MNHFPHCCRNFVYLLIALLLGGGTAHAVVISSYQFPSAAATATASDAGVTASAMSSNIGTVGTDSGFSGSGNAFIRANASPADEAGALSGGSYFSFTITPNASTQLDLTTLAINIGGGLTTGSYTTSIFLRSSVDSFGAHVPITGATGSTTVSGNVASRLISTNAGTTPDVVTFNLSGIAFQDLTSAITFRIYSYDDSASTQAITRFDNVNLSGDVSVVPEPAGGLLVVGALAFVALWRRRGSAAGAEGDTVRRLPAVHQRGGAGNR